MNTIHLAICDDEKSQTTYLRKLVQSWSKEKPFLAEIKDFPSAEAYLFAAEPFDILLLDIQMGRLSGLELAKNLRGTDHHTQIIFVTAFSDFMAEGYDVDAVHYLIKPVNEEKLKKALDKAAARLSTAEPSLIINIDGEKIRLSMNDIFCIESAAHFQEISATNGLYKVKMPIYVLEKQLNDTFIRCHRSYIVGLNHVLKITKTDVVLDNGKIIPISRRLYEDVNKAFIRYYKGVVE